MKKFILILFLFLFSSSASAQIGRAPVRIAEEDGSPVVTNLIKLNVSNGTLTKVSGTEATLAVGGSSLTGTDTQVLFFDGDDSPAGDAGMTYNKTTDTLTVGSVATTAAGQSVINEGLVVNNDGGATETHDFIVNSDTVASAIEVDAGDDVLYVNVPIKINERASADVDLAGYGQVWVKNTTPNTYWFTDDDGTDVQLGVGGAAETLAATLAAGADANDVDTTSWGKMEGFDAGLYLDWDADGVIDLTSDGTLELHSNDWDISATGAMTGISGIVSDGLIDFGGAVVEITNAASPTIDGAGEIAVDTTTDQIQYYGGAKRVLTYFYERGFALEDPVEADDNIPIWHPKQAITITDVYCEVEGATSIGVIISDGTNALEEIICDEDGQADDGSIANGTFSANERMEVDMGTISGTPDWVSVTITYTIDAD